MARSIFGSSATSLSLSATDCGLFISTHSAKTKVESYRQRGKFWIDNVFVKDKLFRSSDGVFTEAGGYDTSYHAVAHLLFQHYQLAFPTDVEEGLAKSLMAGHWLMKRIT